MKYLFKSLKTLPLTVPLLLVSTLLLSGCGSDYEANPQVDEDGFIIVEGGTVVPVVPVTPPPTGPLSSYSRSQLAALPNAIWQSGCANGQRTEMTFTSVSRTSVVFSYDDINCTTLSATAPVASVQSYTGISSVLDSNGSQVTRMELYASTVNGTQLERTIFSIDNNRLYFGLPAVNQASYSTALNLNMPFFAVDSSMQISAANP